MNRLTIIAAAMLGASSLAGCNGIPLPAGSDTPLTGFAKIHSGFPLPYFYVGSAVQWNEHYAVTVAHMPWVAGTVHECSSGCDMKFFRREADGPVPNWRKFHVGERVTSVGNSAFGITVVSQGVALIRPFINEDDGGFYSMHDGAVAKGMSGGPVYGENGDVLGINTGFYSTLLHPKDALESGNVKRMTVFVDYDTIQREWDMYVKESRP